MVKKNNIRYMISLVHSIGSTSAKTLVDARKIAKREAFDAFVFGPHGHGDLWSTIHKYNENTHINLPVEKWRFDGRKYIRKNTKVK